MIGISSWEGLQCVATSIFCFFRGHLSLWSGKYFIPLYFFQAYSAAVQTQWQWIKQLCLCVDQHVIENTAYFQVWSVKKNSLRGHSAFEERLLKP